MSVSSVVSADGTKVEFIDQGRGRPVVIVHGGSSHASDWGRVASGLVDKYRVLRIERRLYSKDYDVATHQIEREVDDVEAVLRSLGEPAFLVGHSSGAVVALEAALRSQDLLAGLVAYEPPVSHDSPIGGEPLIRAEAAIARGDFALATKIHLGEVVRIPGFMLWIIEQSSGWKGLCAAAPAQVADSRAIESLGVGIERYAALKIPVLMLGGGMSPRHLRERLDAVVKTVPQAQRVILRGRGHLANLLSPASVARVIDEFARSVPAGSAVR